MKIDVHNHVGIDPAYEEHRTAKELVDEMGADEARCPGDECSHGFGFLSLMRSAALRRMVLIF